MLILIAHGSRDPKWRAPFERLEAELRADLGNDAVRLCWMEVCAPTLADAVGAAAACGAKQVKVLPLFLASGGHVDNDIPPLVDAARDAHPNIAFHLLPPVGMHAQFAVLLKEIAQEEVERDDEK